MSGTDRPGLGIGLRLLSGLLMTGMFVSVKAVSEAVPLGQVVFFRAAFAMIPLVIFLWLRREFPHGLATKRPFGHLVRSAFGALAMFSSFAAIARLNVAEAILVAQLAPVLMAVAGAFFLSERLTLWRIGGLALGFAGVVVLVWPELGGGASSASRFAGFLYGVVSAALTALALIMVRSLNRTESPGAIALYFVLASMLAALPTLAWGWVWPEAETLALLVAAGLFGGFGHIAMTLAFRFAEASRLAPFEYVALLWVILADVFIFRLPMAATFVISVPLVLAGVALAAAEGKRRR